MSGCLPFTSLIAISFLVVQEVSDGKDVVVDVSGGRVRVVDEARGRQTAAFIQFLVNVSSSIRV